MFLQLRVARRQVIPHLLTYDLIIPRRQLRVEGMVHRDYPQIPRVIEETLALELLEGVGKHAASHHLAIGQKHGRVRARCAATGRPASSCT